MGKNIYQCSFDQSVIIIDAENEKLLMYDSWDGDQGFTGEGILSELNSEEFDKVKEFFSLSDDDMECLDVSRIADDSISMKL